MALLSSCPPSLPSSLPLLPRFVNLKISLTASSFLFLLQKNIIFKGTDGKMNYLGLNPGSDFASSFSLAGIVLCIYSVDGCVYVVSFRPCCLLERIFRYAEINLFSSIYGAPSCVKVQI